jgi:hypothetical protein
MRALCVVAIVFAQMTSAVHAKKKLPKAKDPSDWCVVGESRIPLFLDSGPKKPAAKQALKLCVGSETTCTELPKTVPLQTPAQTTAVCSHQASFAMKDPYLMLLFRPAQGAGDLTAVVVDTKTRRLIGTSPLKGPLALETDDPIKIKADKGKVEILLDSGMLTQKCTEGGGTCERKEKWLVVHADSHGKLESSEDVRTNKISAAH